ncbi:structure-specific endonuclease subunit SLX4 [Wyeomyia smithii]|uniref:structure-specific endonuclease subunit SLX4 n=1 Tax=Wyeomyia smithii TaxID=174621 RepID=UPI002467DA14|nr:structure-specific endonuclease subunit SLX4 [Wyeomyia smithii]
MASGSGKVKYAKLRLPKSLSSEILPDSIPVDNGAGPKSPSKNTTEQMEEGIINLTEDCEDVKECENNERILKRTRLAKTEQPRKSDCPKLPKIPRDGGEGIVSKFFKASEDDFETSQREPVLKAKTKAQRKCTARKPRAARKPKNQSDIRHVFKKYQNNEEQLLNNLMLAHTVADQLDPEQFQLALAMSRSLTDQGGSQPNEEAKASSSMDSPSSEERRIQGIRATLEQYGFKCKNSYTDCDLKVLFGDNPGGKNCKKSRLRRPSLLVVRDDKSLVAFMNQQSDRLFKDELSQSLKTDDNFDLTLRTYGSNVFWMSENPEDTEKSVGDYYVENLVEVSTVKAGYLLKNYDQIRGREPSPNRQAMLCIEEDTEVDIQPVEFEGYDLVEEPEDSRLDMNTVSEEYRRQYNDEVPVHVRPSKSPKRSVSPDLFGSDDCEEQEDNQHRMSESEKVEVPEVKSIPVEEETSDEKFVTVSEMNESNGAVLCTSSENIFEDSDPIVDYEVYTSDEAKISTAGPVEDSLHRPNSPVLDAVIEDSTDHENGNTVITLSSSENSNQEMDRQKGKPFFPSPEKDLSFHALAIKDRLRSENSNQETDRQHDNVATRKTFFPSPEKDLSFHALAIKERLSRTFSKDAETIELEDDHVSDKSEGANSNLSETSRASLLSNQEEPDDQLVISDDEVNYSIRHDFSSIYNASNVGLIEKENRDASEHQKDQSKNDDLDCTKVYFSIHEFPKPESKTVCNIEGVSFISSDEETVEIIETKEAKADNTIAFLDDLIEKYNLPPNPAENDEKISQINKIADEKPDETEQKSAMSLMANESKILGEDIDKVLSQAENTCTQLPDNRSPEQRNQDKFLNRTISDSALLEPMKKKSQTPEPAFKSKCNIESVCLISSDEETVDTIETKVANVDNTNAFLDNLIEKYDLPSNPTESDEKSNQTGLHNYLEHYEIPDFADDEKPNETAKSPEPTEQKSTPNIRPTESKILDEEIAKILTQAENTCTQLASSRSPEQKNQGNPLKRTISDSALLQPRKKKSPTCMKKDSFRDRFKSVAEEPEPAAATLEIRLDNISPRPDYEGMTSPVLHQELFKYGLKLLRRPKAVKMLNYIYDQLHPMVEVYEIEEEVVCQDNVASLSRPVHQQQPCSARLVTSEDTDSGGPVPFVPEMEGEEYILPVKPRKKTFWCAVPLNIAFYNMVAVNKQLRQQILCYQPIDLDAVYNHLKEIGLRYETNDLIAFLDKRCITFRTAQGGGSRTKKRTS